MLGGLPPRTAERSTQQDPFYCTAGISEEDQARIAHAGFLESFFFSANGGRSSVTGHEDREARGLVDRDLQVGPVPVYSYRRVLEREA